MFVTLALASAACYGAADFLGGIASKRAPDMLANALYLVATREGPFSLVATLASLYPASTVLLARVTLGERLSRSQALGVGCGLAAVVLIVRSS